MAQKALMWIVVALLAALFLMDAKRAIDSFNQPTIYLEAYAEKRAVVGGELRLIYRFRRTRICPTAVDRFILHGGDVLWRDHIAGGAAGLGEHTVVNTVRLPDDIPAGHYIFRTFAYATCSEGAHGVMAPDFNFEIVEP